MATGTPVYTPTLTHKPPTPTKTPTPKPTPTLHPTIVIPMLTRTVTPTRVPPPTPTPRSLAENLPAPIIPESLGMEIHFTSPQPGEMAKMKALGFKFIRMDLFWTEIEREPGKYDFTAYDGLVHTLEQYDLNLILILDYGNFAYDGGHAPRTPEGRAAFARFVSTAARRYRDHNIIWEIWNEPNLSKFWSPEPNATDYGQLAITASQAIRQADPDAWIMGPATSGFDRPFWKEMVTTGVLKYFDAISIHPYRTILPETAIKDYLWLRAFLHEQNPQWRIPILSSEWGYYNTPGGYTADQQAEFLVRQWLFNMAHDVKVSIWYDWRNDGHDTHDTEQNFGTVTYDFEPKPAYHAAQTLISTLDGYRFLRRIPTKRPDDYVLLFEKEERLGLACWTIRADHEITLPISAETVTVVEIYGEDKTIQLYADNLTLNLTGAPQYVLFQDRDPFSYLNGWSPLYTLNIVDTEQDEGIPVHINNPRPGSLDAELELTVQGELLGKQTVHVASGEEALFRIPVNVKEDMEGDVEATITLTRLSDLETPESVSNTLQTALIWLQIITPQ